MENEKTVSAKDNIFEGHNLRDKIKEIVGDNEYIAIVGNGKLARFCFHASSIDSVLLLACIIDDLFGDRSPEVASTLLMLAISQCKKVKLPDDDNH